LPGKNVLAIEFHNYATKSSDASATPRLVGTVIQVLRAGEPVLYVQPASLDFGAKTETKSIDLRNTGKGTLVYQIRTSSPWLSVDRSSGYCNETQAILVKVDRSVLTKVGRYTGTLSIDAGAGGMRDVNVSIEIAPYVGEVELIRVGDTWRYLKGTSAAPAQWKALDFSDSTWLKGPSGIGYSSDIVYPTDLRDMSNNYKTVYMRHQFEIPDIDSVMSLKLKIRYDDGFVAYLNGREAARSPSMGPAGTATSFDQGTLSLHDELEDPEEVYSIDVKPGWLSEDENVLAIEFHNMNFESTDACAVPRLMAVTAFE